MSNNRSSGVKKTVEIGAINCSENLLMKEKGDREVVAAVRFRIPT